MRHMEYIHKLIIIEWNLLFQICFLIIYDDTYSDIPL